MPGLVARTTLIGRLHFDKYIPRIKHLLRNDSLTAAHLHNFLSRNQDVVNLILQVEGLYATSQALSDLTLKPGVRMNDVPVLGHHYAPPVTTPKYRSSQFKARPKSSSTTPK